VRSREQYGNTGDARIFRQIHASRWIGIDVVLVVWGCLCPHFISKGAGVSRKVSELVTIVVLVWLYF
jgi:hypothetical protein